MSYKLKRLGKNTIFVFCGKAGSSLLTLLMLPLYTSWLSPEQYGSVDLMNTYSSILMSIVSFCIYDSIFVIPSNVNKNEQGIFYSSGYAFIFTSIVLLSILLCVLTNSSNNSAFIVENGWMILSLTMSMVLLNYSQQFTRTLGKLGVFSITGIIHTASIAIFAFVYIPFLGVFGYILSLICSNIVSFLYSFIASKSYEYVSIRFIKYSYLSKLLKYGIPLIPNSIMWWLVNGFNRPIMEAKLGLEAIGLYAIAVKFPNILSSLSDVFMNAFGLTLVEEYGKNTFDHIFNKVLKIYMMVIVLVAIIIIIFSPIIISFFADEEFYSAWRLLPGLSVSAILSSMSGLIGGVFMAKKESKYFLYSSIYGAIASLVLTYTLINRFGMTGCITSVCLSFGIMLLVRIYYAWNDIRTFDIKYYLFLLCILVFSVLLCLSDLMFRVKVIGYLFVIFVYYIINRKTIYTLYREIKNRNI